MHCRIGASYILEQFKVERNEVAAPLMQLCDNSHDRGSDLLLTTIPLLIKTTKINVFFYNIKFAADMVTAGQFGVHLVREFSPWSCQVLYWISPNIPQSPLMYYNIQYVICFIKKQKIYQCKDRDPDISTYGM